MDNLHVNGVAVLENVPVIFDTNSEYIFGDWNRVAELYKPLRAKVSMSTDGEFGYYYLPCEAFRTLRLGLTFGGRTFEISPGALNIGRIQEYSPYCFSAVIAQRSHTEFWNVGMTFLKDVYSVFNYKTGQVGFADLANLEPED